MSGSLFVVSAPSGAGKTSLIKALRTELQENVAVAVSHTTRPRRASEKDGDSYYFVDKTAFKELIDADMFIEYAQVFGHYYGTSRQTISEQIARGKDMILEIDWQGALQVRKLYPQAKLIFILPPSLTTLEQRLRNRATDDERSMQKRLAGALTEIAQYRHYDYLIINDDFHRALDQLKTILLSCRLLRDRQECRSRKLIQELETAGC